MTDENLLSYLRENGAMGICHRRPGFFSAMVVLTDLSQPSASAVNNEF